MEIINETGIVETPFFIMEEGKPAHMQFNTVKKFYYVSAFWYNGFKFVIGSCTEGQYDQVIEVSTGAKCSDLSEIPIRKGDTKQLLMDNFYKKLFKHGVPIGELVNRFNFKNNGKIQAWQSLLIS